MLTVSDLELYFTGGAKMKTSRPWYMRKIVLPVLCVLGVAIPNLLNYCDVDGFSNHSGYFGFGCLNSLFYAVGIEWQNMVFFFIVPLFITFLLFVVYK